MVEYGYREKPKTTSHRLEAGPVIIPSSRRRLIHGAALFVVRKQARRKNNKPGLLPAADLPGAPARLYSAGHRPITQPATAKWRPMEASAQWAVRRRRKRPEAVSAQRSVGPAPRGPQAYWANGTRAKAGTTGRGCDTQRTEQRRAADRTETGSGNPQGLRAHSRQKPDAKRPLFGQAMRPQARGREAVPLERQRRTGGNRAGRRTGGAGRTEPHTQEAATAWPPRLHAGTAGTAGRPGKSGRSRGGGIVAAKEAPNRREPCRAGGRWGGPNRSRRRTRPRRPGRPFLRGMPRTRAAEPGADGAAGVGIKVLMTNCGSGTLPGEVLQGHIHHRSSQCRQQQAALSGASSCSACSV